MKSRFILINSIIFLLALFYFYLSPDIIERENSQIPDNELISGPESDWFVRQRAFPFDDIPNDERLKSIEYVKTSMPVSDLGIDANWSLVGPYKYRR